eukprot:ANDGO_05611.mRNA.1 hypothetical protein
MGRKDASYRKSMGIFCDLRKGMTDCPWVKDLSDDEIQIVCLRICENSSDDDDMDTLQKTIINELKRVHDERLARESAAQVKLPSS